MISIKSTNCFLALSLSFLLISAGCSDNTEPEPTGESAGVDLGDPSGKVDLGNSEPFATSKTRKPISLSGKNSGAGSGGTLDAEEKQLDSVMEALRPLQVLLGTWEGKTFRKVGGFASLETVNWVWDLKSDRNQPALAMKADKSQYLQSARLTYLLDKQVFQLAAIDKEGTERVYQGSYSKPVEDVPGDTKKLERTFQLKLTQVIADAPKKIAEIVINQQKNDRYLMEVYNQSGEKMFRYDTIANQRQGTSFAISDSDYGEKTCVISQGLGTTQVSFEGKTFWVCCSGCKAAFEDEPKRWIAKFEARKKSETK